MFYAMNQEWIHCVPCHESGVDPLCPMPHIRSGSTVSHAMNQEWIHCVPCHESGVDPLRSVIELTCQVHVLKFGFSFAFILNYEM